MKMLLFLSVLLISGMCCREREDTKRGVSSTTGIKKDSSRKNLEVPDVFESFYGNDTGYFKNGELKIISLNTKDGDSSELNTFLKNNLDKSGIIVNNKYGLWHSCRISQDTTIRIDTLQSDSIFIVQKIDLVNDKLLSLNINGRKLDTKTEDLLFYNAGSFIDFSFKGHSFYYIRAQIIGTSGGSAGLLYYHLIYSKERNEINTFTSFRVDNHIFFGDINGDDRLDFVGIENEGGYGAPGDSINHFSMNIYSCNNRTGKFELLRDKLGKNYFIEGNTGTDRYLGDSMNITKQNWPKPVN